MRCCDRASYRKCLRVKISLAGYCVTRNVRSASHNALQRSHQYWLSPQSSSGVRKYSNSACTDWPSVHSAGKDSWSSRKLSCFALSVPHTLHLYIVSARPPNDCCTTVSFGICTASEKKVLLYLMIFYA